MCAERARELNRLLLDVRREQRSAEYRLAKLLAELADQRLFQQLGYATLCHFSDTVLGLHRRQTRALCALGQGLPELPALDTAFEAGELGWTKAREVLRVATPQTVGLWVDFAMGHNSGVLERAVAECHRGDSPPVAGQEPRRQAPQRSDKWARMGRSEPHGERWAAWGEVGRMGRGGPHGEKGPRPKPVSPTMSSSGKPPSAAFRGRAWGEVGP